MSMMVESGACCRPIDDKSCGERVATVVDDEIWQGLAACGGGSYYRTVYRRRTDEVEGH
jgi:hypothetical protein